jgi:adenosylhomocysteine nucleosidase
MLALLGALRPEITGIQRRLTTAEVIARPDFKLYRGKYQNRDCLLVQTGLGKQRAETATHFILEHFPVSAMISFGFAGALTAELRVGDIIICSTLYHCNGRADKGLESESLSSDANLLELAIRTLESGRVRFCCGNSVTVPQLLSSPESKEKLYKISQAHIADMESYWVAGIASEERIPFVAIRAVSDTMQDSLPPFDQVMAGDGSWLWRKVFSYFVLRPQDLPKLPGLYSGSRKARKSLTDCVGRIVANMN